MRAHKRAQVTTTPPPFLDLTPAKDLAGNDEQLRQLVQTFEVSLAEEIEKISHALATHNQQQVEFSLHTLKGFVGLFVVPTLALQVELLYKNCRNQPLAITATEFNALVPSFQTLLSEVRGWLSL
ncbi:MAG: Hpt domain-containing protein [Limnohabitans sp.]|nr:Hpt domain-containing protein [Limnohabitans sp.]